MGEFFSQPIGCKSWSNMMSILNEKECADTEILIFTFTLFNKTLAGISDQDTYYDMIDSLEEQGMERIIKSIMSKKGIEKDLMKQLQIYELVLKHEDEGPSSDDDGIKLNDNHSLHSFDIPIEAVTNRGRSRASKSSERRRSRRHSSVGHSLIANPAGTSVGCKTNANIKSLSFVPPPKNTKVIEDLVPNWQRKVLESNQQYTSSNTSSSNGNLNNNNFTTSKMLQEVNNNINSNGNSNSNNHHNTSNKSEAVIKIKEVGPKSKRSTSPPPVSCKPKSLMENNGTINKEESIVPLKRDFRPSSKDGGDLMYNNFSGQRASISSTSSADSYGSSTSSGAYSMVSSTPSSVDHHHGDQKSSSIAANNTKSSLIEKRKKVLFEQQQQNSSNLKSSTSCLPQSENNISKRINDVQNSNSNGSSQYSIPSDTCIDTSKNYLLSKMYDHHEKVPTNGTKIIPTNNSKVSWEPINDTTSKLDKSSIPGSSIGVKIIQEKMLRTSGSNDHLNNGHNVSSNIREVIRNPSEFLHLHKASSSPNRRPSPSSRRPFRPLKLNDLDFTDLKPEDDQDILNGTTTTINGGINGDQEHPGSPVIPCPPPLPTSNCFQPPPIPPPPPPLPGMGSSSSLSPLQSSTPGVHQQQLNNHKMIINYNNNLDANKNNYNQTMTWLKSSNPSHTTAQLNGSNGNNDTVNSSMSSWSVVDGQNSQNMIGNLRGCINPNFNSSMYQGMMSTTTMKNKKTVKLFWKEVKEEKSILNRLKKKKTIWDEITMIPVDPVKMEHLFENRTKELVNKVRFKEKFAHRVQLPWS